MPKAIKRKTKSASSGKTTHPKTTRPAASDRREPPPLVTTGERIKRKLDAVPDRIDVRDWMYQPTLQPLPDQVVNCDMVPKILDQGTEGACTGFALAALINYQLAVRQIILQRDESRLVSPRMLYEMARRYDEWPGEKYDGSSARGAMKGWIAHGVTRQTLWPDSLRGHEHLTQEISDDASTTPGGAYFRVMHRNIRDIHAAVVEVGAVYATLMVHVGWDEPGPQKQTLEYVLHGSARRIDLPIIQRKERADSGHAILIVGYTHDGFIIQNSWGEDWGTKGFALLPYEDWMLHATDCWAAQLGVPVNLNVWQTLKAADTLAGSFRAQAAIPLSEIRPYVIDIGNNGQLSDSGQYWTTKSDVERLFTTIAERASGWKKRRVMLYLHGGLNDEIAVARRVIAYRDVCLANEIYPVHIMWETGFWESLKNSVLDLFVPKGELAGGTWLDRMRDGVVEAKDRTIELTAAVPGTVLWSEMKENGELASAPGGGMRVFAQCAQQALAGLSAADRKQWELHVVGHSAGSIFAASAAPLLTQTGVAFKTLQLMAPAIRIDLFKERLLPFIKNGECPRPSMYILSDQGERDDDVGPYGKSLLYLVSNAFEGARETPLLGMQRFISIESEAADTAIVDADIEALLKQPVDGRPALVVAGAGPNTDKISDRLSRSDSHGGFDNDVATMNSVLYRILDDVPPRPFGVRDLQFD